ncbi:MULTISPECIES: hypothetical protein [Streptomyces]|uniref:hypothetical protein n=1 Tax=Streptomyces TaxID=1883 RepID=UPI00117D5B88|nr:MULTISPECIES: hypothetical protein [unclassified Streptomyces]
MESELLFAITGAMAAAIPIALEIFRKLRAGHQADRVTIRSVDGRMSISAGGRIGAVITGGTGNDRHEPVLLDPANENDVNRVLNLLDDPKRGEGS